MITGNVAAVEAALTEAVEGLRRVLDFFPCRVTKT